jgi:hypothetical protein
MAWSLNGCGTTFYGKREFRADGTYITTEWVTAFYLPLIPLRSFRVRHQGPGEGKVPIGFGSAERYLVFRKTAPNWRQVISVYALVILYVAWLCLVLQIGTQLYPDGLQGQNLGFAGLALAVLGPLAMPLILRRRARKRGSQHSDFQAQPEPHRRSRPLPLLPPTFVFSCPHCGQPDIRRPRSKRPCWRVSAVSKIRHRASSERLTM